MNLSLFTQDGFSFSKLPPKKAIILKKSVIRKIMRTGLLSVILFIITSIQLLFGSPVRSQNVDEVNITIGLDNETLVQAFHKIEAHSPFRFMYRKDEVKDVQNIEIKPGTRTVGQLLRNILNGTTLTYQQVNNQVLIMSIKNFEYSYSAGTISTPKIPKYIPKANIVKGHVTNSQGEALAGVSVTIKGTQTGTLTDENGNYSLDVPVDGIIVFSFVGFEAQEMPVNGRETIDVTLETANTGLDEVVVIGYGTQQKRDLTGAVSQISGEALENHPVSNAASAMVGKAPGVALVFNNGEPGNEPNIRIRGTGTINNSDPLIVIDGVPVPVGIGGLGDINPNDIQSIEILKDASASAIYGSRAANGVVLVTTRKGKLNESMKTSINYFTGFNKVSRYIDLLTAPQLVELKQERYINDGTTIPPIWLDPNTAVQRTDWQKALYKTGRVNNADVAVRGGNSTSTYSFSGNYYKDEGIIPTSFFRRYSFKINSEHNIGKFLKIGENILYANTSQNNPNTESPQTGLIFTTLRYNPSIPVLNDDGSWGTSQADNELGDINNPFTYLYEIPAHTDKDRLLTNGYVELEITKGLKVRANYGYNQTLTNIYRFDVATPTQTRGPAVSTLTRGNQKMTELLEEYFLTYNKIFGDNHHVDFVMGYSSQVDKGDFINAVRVGYADTSELQRVLDLGENASNSGNNFNSVGLQSYFVRGNYSYKGKYLATATFRADGSSKFADGKRWGYFPAFSLGWRISDESFFPKNDLVNSLKVIGGWGQLGNQNIDPYQYLSIIGVGAGNLAYNIGTNSQSVTGARILSLANPNITWERAVMTNIGIEFGGLNNKLLGSVTYFNKNTMDMLMVAQIVKTFGRSSLPNVNLGEINNHGVEFELSYQNVMSKLVYNVGVNGSFIRNKVTRLYGTNDYISSPIYGRSATDISRTYEGQPIASFYGYKTEGLYQNQNEIDHDPYVANDPQRNLIQPGDVRFVDINGDGIVDDKDRTYLGDPNPRFEYGINGSLKLGQFDLALSFKGSAGVKIYYADRLSGLQSSSSFNWYAEQLDRWHGEGTSNTIPRLTKANLHDNYRSSDLWVMNGNYLALKSASLGYTITNKTLGKAVIPDIRIYLSGYNIFFMTKYKGYSPELGYTNGNEGHTDRNIQRGIDVGQYPQSRNITVGATVNF